MQSSDKKILIPIDDDPSTTKAVSVAVRRAKEWMDEGFSVSIVLVNLYSEWDILGRDESNGKLAMDQAESFVTASGIKNVAVVSDSSYSSKRDILTLIGEHKFDLVVVGETSYTSNSDPDSFIANAWTWLVNTVSTPLPQYLAKHAECEVDVVSSAGAVDEHITRMS